MIGDYIGNYRLTRLLGEGGMGMVYEAVHDGVGGRAAIKVLRPEVAIKKDATTRLFNEARAANSISHPGIVRIFDCGYTSQGIAYLTMEYLEGESLRARVEREHVLPQFDALRIGRQIASALQAAHQRQVVHRDLKPDNIMLVADPEMPGGERVKLLDFGVAKLAETLNGEPLQTRSDTLMGTPTFMAPEQCRGAKHVTDRSDVYSLGVILYQLLSGMPPFLGESVGELIAMHLADSEPPLASVAPHVHPEVCAVVHSMLRKRPSDRPSVEEVAQELKRLMVVLGEAQGISAGQTRRMFSEAGIPLLPPLSPEQQALMGLNNAQPTLGDGTEIPQGPLRSPPPGTLPPHTPPGSGSASGLKPVARAGVISPSFVHGSTWDGDAVVRPARSSGPIVPGALPPAENAAAKGAAVTGTPEATTAAVPPVAASVTAPVAVIDPGVRAKLERSSMEGAPVSAELMASAATPRRPSVTAPTPVLGSAPVAVADGPTGPLGVKGRSRAVWLLAGVPLVGLLLALAPLITRDGTTGGSTRPPVGDATAQTGKGGTSTTPDKGLSVAPQGTGTQKGPPGAQTDLGGGTQAIVVPPAGVAGAGGTTAVGPGPGVPAGATEPEGTNGGKGAGGDATRPALVAPDPKRGTSAADVGMNVAFSALRSRQYDAALQAAQTCVDAKPQNYRCWWILGIAACSQKNMKLVASARGHLAELGKSALISEVDDACQGKLQPAKADGGKTSMRLADEPPEWTGDALRLFEAGRFSEAQRLAEKNVAHDAAAAWSLIGRTACALGDSEKANIAVSKVADKSKKNEIVLYCVGKGFAYSVDTGVLKKRFVN